MKTLDEAADCIEGTNSLVDHKIAFARRLRENQIELLGLESIERDARRQLQACRLIRTIMDAAARRPEPVERCPGCGITVFTSSDDTTGHCGDCKKKAVEPVIATREFREHQGLPVGDTK
jgi:hypothetical protein